MKDERSSAELLAGIDDMLDTLPAEDVDVERLLADLALLQKRAPVEGGKTPREAWARFEERLRALDGTPETPRRRAPGRAALALRGLLAAALAALLLGGTAYAIFPEVRRPARAFLVEQTDSALVLRMLSDGGEAPKEAEDRELLWGYALPLMPEGFTLSRRSRSRDAALAVFTGPDGAFFRVAIRAGATAPEPEDGGERSQVVLNGRETSVSSLPDGTLRLSWTDALTGRGLLVEAGGLDRDETVLLAGQIRYVL